ncbi:ATP-binding cassette domain-containing protein [Corynebacterium auriscanis]|uniref:ATP-binding cassette domain-containing protein n=1 Tax=Corynebacterium auriscanis TaxID=99807 RepID=UPI0022470A74|nr:ABC transporter ATP-binding protein [Corynebacterium auriscanis]MCX2163901.1 ABC transporter ATP-binding protein [Corynebacterium auriscanis]
MTTSNYSAPPDTEVASTGAQFMTGSIDLRGVGKKFSGGHRALHDVTTHLPGGRIYGLIGRNGAGKTTLLRAIAGQLRVEGDVTIDGQQVIDNRAVLDRLILSGPDAAWPTDVKVNALLAMGAARWETWNRDLAARYVKEYDLDVKKSLGTMSRGQKSLVSIVMGLAAQCPITLLDEPYLGLDVQNREMFYRHLLEDVERNPRTIILSTHHIEDASKILEDVIFIDRGRITGVDALERVTERIAVLTGSEAAVSDQLAALNAQEALLSETTMGGQRRVFVDIRALGRGNPHAVPMDSARMDNLLAGTGVRMTHPDLEQAVMALTGRELGVNDSGHSNT